MVEIKTLLFEGVKRYFLNTKQHIVQIQNPKHNGSFYQNTEQKAYISSKSIFFTEKEIIFSEQIDIHCSSCFIYMLAVSELCICEICIR